MDLIDARAIASGKRRSNLATYREAQEFLATLPALCDDLGRPVLFAGGPCVDCGEPYSSPPLISRCAERHHV